MIMPRLHFINVSPGDCTLIQHASGRVTMIDICDGYVDVAAVREKLAMENSLATMFNRPRGNFAMCEYPTNPIHYARSLGIGDIFRFILSHPDMDHMDGLDALLEAFAVNNFWHSGIERESPDFSFGGFREEDWRRYERLRAGRDPGVATLLKLAGARFQYANYGDDQSSGGDGLYILAPSAELVAEASADGDINDGSYVILYRSMGGRIIIPGDAHDRTWDYVLRHYPNDVENCSVLIAPHHGRHSDRSYDFLDHIKPKLTLFGSAPSEHLAYDAWNRRGLQYITSNQAGNVVLDILQGGINAYVENERFAAALGRDCLTRNEQGYRLLGYIGETAEKKVSASRPSAGHYRV
jgi:beta-lactamase superfamily II metal-dependent hydrolase